MRNKEFLLRPASNNDIPSIKKIIFSSLEEFGLKPEESGKDNDLNDIEKNYAFNNGFFGVAVNINEDDIVGSFGLYKINDDTCELRKMYLAKKVRGKGLGKFILESAIRIAKEKNYKKIVLETISPLTAAISLYKKYGFGEVKPKEINARVDQAFELDIS